MKIKITEEQDKMLKEAELLKETSLENFIREVKLFLYSLISNDGDLQIKSKFWQLLGKSNSDVLKLLQDYDIIDEIGLPKPKNDFDRKVIRLYNHLLPQTDDVLDEDFGGNCAGGVGGSYEAPFSSTIIKKIS